MFVPKGLQDLLFFAVLPFQNFIVIVLIEVVHYKFIKHSTKI